MPAFRAFPFPVAVKPDGVADSAVASLLTELFQPGNFVAAPPLEFEWHCDVVQTIPWELHHGRLLESSQTRRQHTFRSWTMTRTSDGVAAAEPTLALRFAPQERVIHVTRGLLCHVQEPYDSGDNVILTRDATRWISELVATVRLDDCADVATLADEVMGSLWLGVIGTSRLPLTSLEAPLPDFVLGQLTYLYRGGDAGAAPLRGWRELIAAAPWDALSERERAKVIEFSLRAAAPEHVADVVDAFADRGLRGTDFTRLLKVVFNEVSLSPYTGFVDAALACTTNLTRRGVWSTPEEVDFLGWLLRQLGRHLTAYDLVTFHHRGANYPDALLLDGVLTAYLGAMERSPHLFEGGAPKARLRRRALRQGCLVRRRYEGHPAPDAPTSPGENMRAMPAPFAQAPEEQILNPSKRTRRLFADTPLTSRLSESARRVLAQSLADLHDDAELAELGMAVFIDRPLGLGKAATAPDQTPLLAHEAFSAAIARGRLEELRVLADESATAMPGPIAELMERLHAQPPATGLPLDLIGDLGRPVASLADARRASGDFVVTRTLGLSGVGNSTGLFRLFDWTPVWRDFELEALRTTLRWIVRLNLGGNPGVMALVDNAGVPRLLFEADPSEGYGCRGGVEFPRAGLRIWHVRDDAGHLHDLRNSEVRVRAGR